MSEVLLSVPRAWSGTVWLFGAYRRFPSSPPLMETV